MKLIIDIPEVFYEALRNTNEIISGQRSGKTLMSVIYNAVANGTPLPKGHGRLIDADELKKIIKENDILYTAGFSIRLCDINSAQTIIEADKESEE